MSALSRRTFLKSASYVSFGAAAITTLGCGGLFFGAGAPTTGTLTQQLFSGTINLPGIDLANLKIVGPLGSIPINGANFQVKGFTEFPCVITINDPVAGKSVFVGMLDPDSTTHVLDAANCAATLLFLALGGSQLFGDERQSFWTSVLALPSLGALTAVVAARLAADRFALENSDSQITAALDTAAHGTNITLPAATHGTNKSSQTNGKGRADDDLTITHIHPHVGQALSGMMLFNNNNQGVGFRTIRRREVMVHLYPGSGRNAEGQIHPPVSTHVVPPFKIEALGSTEPISVGLYQDDVATTYDAICLSPLFDSPQAGIFVDGVFEGEKATWRADLVKMYKRAEVGLVCKILLEAVGMSGVKLDPDTLDAVIQNLAGMGGETGSLVLAAEDGTDLSDGIKGFVQQARSGDTMALDYLTAIAPLVQTSNPVLYYDLSHRNYHSEQLGAFRAALRMIAFTGAMALSLELGPEYKDLTFQDDEVGEFDYNGIRCEFNVIRASVRLSPSGGEYFPGTDVVFTVTVEDITEPLSYKWNLSHVTNASLDDGHGNAGYEFESNEKTVTLKTHANSIDNAIVSVEVFAGTGEDKRSLDTVSSTLTKHGTTGLGIDTWHINTTTYIYGLTYYDKPKTLEGGNHYKGGRLKADIIYDDLSNPGNSGSQHMEWNVPAYVGLPVDTSAQPPNFVGTKIPAAVGGGSSSFAGADVYDLGDRVAVIKIRGEYYDSSTQQQIDDTIFSVQKHIADTTLTLLFVPSS